MVSTPQVGSPEARSRRLARAGLAACLTLTLLAGPARALAQAPSFCPPGQAPRFVEGFAFLKGQVGAAMGEPTECERYDADGNALQRTTTGEAFWQKSINTPMFSVGERRWAWTPDGLVQWVGPRERRVDPADVRVPAGYRIEPFASGLSYATDLEFGPDDEVFVAETGDHTYGTTPEKSPTPQILQLMPDGSKRVVYDKAVSLETLRAAKFGQPIPEEGLIGPVLGITWRDGLLYVAHRTRVSTLDPKTGAFKTVIDGLPSWGFFHNNKVVFGPDGKMYFVLSTQGNAGPIDEHWMAVINIYNKRDAHEVPCEDVALTGKNFAVPVEDPATPEVGDKKLTGVYVPLGTETRPGQVVKGSVPCNGAMLRANPDGSGLELVAWGLRSNFGYRFAPDGRLIVSQNSGNPIEPRAIYEDWETLWEIRPGEWYGWPDYYSGLPVTDPRFAERLERHDFVLTEETRRRLLKGRERPPQPLARLAPNTAAEGFVFGRPAFGVGADEVLVAEFGTVVVPKRDELPGFRVQRVNLVTGASADFLVNRTGKPASATFGGGLERPIQLTWGPDGALYVVDFGRIDLTAKGMEAKPNSGVVWKVTRG